jgi:hypothetical protein
MLVAGKKVYDPRSDTTQSFGTGPHRLPNSLTWEWSDNPALCWADYMIDSNLGFGEDSSRIDYGYVASAAGACEVVVNNPTGADPLTDNRWRCNGALSAGDTYEANIQRILSSMNGMANLVNGVWKVRASGYVTPTLSYDDNTLRGNAQIKLHPDERERFNTVRGQFIDPARKWQNVAFPEVTAAEYVTRDNNQKLYRDVSLDMTKDLYMAQRLAFGILEQSDLEATAVLPTNFKTLPAEVGGTLQYSNEKMGWTDKEFRVLRYKLSDMGGIDLVVREDDAAAYTVVGTAEYSVANDGGYVTNDPGVPEPVGINVDNVQGGILINWTNPAARLYEYTEIYRSPNSNWNDAVLIDDSRMTHYLDVPPQDAVNFYFLRSRNFAGAVSSYIPAGSSAFGVYVQPSMVIASDPTFNQSRQRVGLYNGIPGDGTAGQFWNTQSYQTQSTGGKNTAYAAMVHSDGTGTGSSSILRFNFWIGSDHSGVVAVPVDNRRQVPIIRGQAVTSLLRYRVTSWTNILSAHLNFGVSARKSLFSTGATLLASPMSVSIVNSVDWSVTSRYANISLATNIGSFSYVTMRLQPQIDYTATDTGYLCIEIDDAYGFFVNSE